MIKREKDRERKPRGKRGLSEKAEGG